MAYQPYLQKLRVKNRARSCTKGEGDRNGAGKRAMINVHIQNRVTPGFVFIIHKMARSYEFQQNQLSLACLKYPYAKMYYI